MLGAFKKNLSNWIKKPAIRIQSSDIDRIVMKGDTTTKWFWRFALKNVSCYDLLCYALCKDYSVDPSYQKAMYILDNVVKTGLVNLPDKAVTSTRNQLNQAKQNMQRPPSDLFDSIRCEIYTNCLETRKEFNSSTDIDAAWNEWKLRGDSRGAIRDMYGYLEEAVAYGFKSPIFSTMKTYLCGS